MMAGPVGLFGSGILWKMTPSELILTGSQLGQPIEEPSAEPTVRKIPKSLFASFGSPALKVPLGSNPKLRPSPPISNDPIFTLAPSDPNCTRRNLSLTAVGVLGSLNTSIVLVSIVKSTAVIVRNPAILIASVSALNLKFAAPP